MSVRLFIGNLPYAATEVELREHLSGRRPTITSRAPGRSARRHVREVSRSWTTPTARSLKKRFAGITSSRSKDGRWQSAKPGLVRIVPPGPRPGGGFGGPRPPGPSGFAPRPSGGGGFAPRPVDAGTGGQTARNRNFGPDAPPKNKRKPPRKDGDRGPKGPIKERPVGRLYDADEDWQAQPDDDLDIDDVATSAKQEDTEKTEKAEKEKDDE